MSEREDVGACMLAKRLDDKGYGRAYHEGKTVGAHRLAYCQHHGIPLSAIAGKMIRHKCDNPPCINPLHLEPGTAADNMRDMVERGRQCKWEGRRRGEGNPKCRLKQADVDAIRSRYIRYSVPHGTKSIARDYGVSHRTIVDIVLGRTWK